MRRAALAWVVLTLSACTADELKHSIGDGSSGWCALQSNCITHDPAYPAR